MAHLYNALSVCGARAADGTPVSSGRAWFFQPGTVSSQAVVYGDADGLAAISQPVALDAGGRCTVYTKSAVRVQIEDQNGALVSVFDRGNTIQASEVEIESTSFTGTVLSGSSAGSQGAGGRIDLATALSRLYASTGGVDAGYQIVSTSGARLGAPLPLTTAITSIAVNVKSFLCGDGLPVAGDGIHVDTTGIQAALSYLASIGGGVLLFPPGTYLIDQPITLTGGNGVSILGSGGKVSIIKNTNGVFGILSFTSCNSFSVSNIGTSHSSTSTGAAFTFTNCSDVHGTGIILDPVGTGTHATGVLFAGTGGGSANTFLTESTFRAIPGAAGSRALKYTGSGASSDGHFITNCIISGSNGGTAIETTSNVNNVFIGLNRFIDGTGSGGIIVGGNTGYSIIHNKGFQGFTTPLTISVSPADVIQTGNAIDFVSTTVAGAGNYTPNRAQGNFFNIRATGTTATVNNPTPIPVDNAMLTLKLFNNAGAAVTWTMGAAYKLTAAIPTTDAHKITLLLQYDFTNGVFQEVGRTDTT